MNIMNRRDLLKGAAGAVLATGVDRASGQAASSGGNRPNLVYIFADQLRYFSCSYAGDEYARTPNIDRLASEGCNFHQAISSTPVCAPHRASLMTGKYQSSTGMVINELRLSPEHDCFGKVLTKGGYQTAYIGKWHMWANELGHHDQTKNAFVPPGSYRLGFDGFWAAYNFNHSYYHSPYFLDSTDRHVRKQFEADGQTDMAIDFLRQNKVGSQPFALFLSWGPPHDPWDWDNVVPEYADIYRRVDLPLRLNYSDQSDPYADDWQKLPPNYHQLVHDWQRAYYAQSMSIDYNVGRILKALDDEGLSDNTILVFTSDHGEMFGSHGRRAKYIFYEEAARVPFLVRWRGKIPAKLISDALLGTPDIMPTILSLLNLPIPGAVEGMDLSSHALGKGGSDHEAAQMQGMGATAAWTNGSEWRASRDREYTYAIYRRDRRELLFNNWKDPYQLTNLADNRGERAKLAHYRSVSENWRRTQNDSFEACSWYESRWTKDRNITMTGKGVSQDLAALKQITDQWLPAGVGDRTG